MNCKIRREKQSIPYNPEEIFSIDELLNGYVQIEHIIPYSISLNNSFANKTLCDARINDEKGNRTPYQYFQDQPERWQFIKDHIFDILPHWKARRFISKTNPDSDDFIERQLNDTRYISKLSRNYLKHICSNVNVAQGTLTSMLRHFWRLDGILGGKYEAPDLGDGEYLAAAGSDDKLIEITDWDNETLKKDQKRLKKKGRFLQGNVKDGIFYPFKQRTDHRHHAVDALAVACSEKKYLQQVSRLSGRGYNNTEIKRTEQFDLPWKTFWADANDSIHQILVSHKQTDRVLTKVKKRLYDYHGNPKTDKHGNKLPPAEGMAARGQLHKETVYGKHEGKDGKDYFHVRKSLKDLTKAQIKKIADPKIRKLIQKAVEEADGKLKNAFFSYDKETKKRTPLVHLSNKNGAPIPVKKVRIRETMKNAAQLKDGVNQYVNPRNNHHVLLYEKNNGKLAERIVTFWEAVERKSQNQPVIQLPPDGNRIVATLKENDLFLLNLANEQIRDNIDNQAFIAKHLYRIQKLSTKGYNFRLATESTLDNNIMPYYCRISSLGNSKRGWQRFNPVKVSLSPIGEIELDESS